MKLDTRAIAGFLNDPKSARMILLYGENEGLLRERAEALTRKIAGSLNDPFLVAELNRDTWPRMAAEMAAISLIGGRRVVRVREVTDAALEPVKAALKTKGDALLVLEAPNLGRGKLRSFAEAAADAAAVPCYNEEGRALQDTIRAILTECRAKADPDAVAWLADTLGGDRGVVRGEVEKLALLVGPGGTVDLEQARSCTGDSAGAAGEEGVLAATCGQGAEADTATERAIAEGMNGVGLLRVALGHLQKLHQARLRMDAGLSAADAVKTMRPPVFFRAAPAMTQSLSLWSSARLLQAINEARAAELGCKQTGSRPELLARRYVAWLARAAKPRG